MLALLALPLLTSSTGAEEAAAPKPVVQPSLTLTGESWHAFGGGLQKGSRWNTLANLSLDFDLARMGGPAGSGFVAQANWIENQHPTPDFGDLTGAFNPVSGNLAVNQVRVFNLHYRQSWDEERVCLKIGQLAIDDDFMACDTSALFVNSSFGAMATQVGTPLSLRHENQSAFPAFPAAGPGVWVSYKASEALKLQAGLYHGGPGPDETGNHGFNWRHGEGVGQVLFYEADYSFSPGGLPATLRAGGGYHFGRFDDYSAMAETESEVEARGLYSFYLIHDQVLLQSAPDKPRLAGFWRLSLSPQQDRSVVHFYADAGLNWFGPIPSRPEDVVGMAVAHTQFGRGFRVFTGRDTLASSEGTLELTYRAQVTSALAVQADFQRLSDPAPDASGNRRTASVLGLRVEYSF